MGGKEAGGPGSRQGVYRRGKTASTTIPHTASRAFNGPTDNFWERLFRLYRRRLWRCDWRGVYPRQGKFLTYRRL